MTIEEAKEIIARQERANVEQLRMIQKDAEWLPAESVFGAHPSLESLVEAVLLVRMESTASLDEMIDQAEGRQEEARRKEQEQKDADNRQERTKAIAHARERILPKLGNLGRFAAFKSWVSEPGSYHEYPTHGFAEIGSVVISDFPAGLEIYGETSGVRAGRDRGSGPRCHRQSRRSLITPINLI